MKTFVVQLEPHDDVVSVRDKISWSKAARVLLVWPRRGVELDRSVDLLLLLRHARSLGAQLAFVAYSPEVKRLSRELGIPVFRSVNQAQRSSWRRARGRRPLDALLPGRKRTDPYTLRSLRQDLPGQTLPGMSVRAGSFVAGVAAFLVLVLFLAPAARVEIIPARRPQQVELTVWAGPAVRSASAAGGLPVQPVSVVVEGQLSAPSTGTAAVPIRAASGHVQMTNLSAEPLEVPRGSILLTLPAPSVRFKTTRSVSLPAGPGTSAEVPVEAVQPGRAGNISPGEIGAVEGPQGMSLSVENLESISGGLERAAAATSLQDYRALKEQVLAGLQPAAVEELRVLAGKQHRLLEETVQVRTILEETLEPPVGRPGEAVRLNLRVEFEAWAVSESDLQAVAQAALDANSAPGERAVPGSLRVTFLETLPGLMPDQPGARGAEPAGGAGNIIRWQIRAERDLEDGWDAKTLADGLLGCPVSQAARVLGSRLALAAPPMIEMYPAWWPFMPFLSFRIQVVQP